MGEMDIREMDFLFQVDEVTNTVRDQMVFKIVVSLADVLIATLPHHYATARL